MTIKSGSSSGGTHRRRWRRWIAFGGLVGLLAVAVPSALAIHDFTDVPDASPFHADISAVKGAGITSGKTCVPPGTLPTYCPTEDITREAMAAFVHRGFGRSGFSASGFTLIGGGPVDLGVITIQVGGVAGNVQFVKLDGTVNSEISNTTDCPCDTEFFIVWDGVGNVSGSSFQSNTAISNAGFGDITGAVTAVVGAPTATTQTFRLQALRASSGGTVVAKGNFTAITAPFGSSGGSTLGTTTIVTKSAPGSRG